MMRTDKADPAAEVHSCRACSTTRHFRMAKSFTERHGRIDLVSVNMRLSSPGKLEGIEVLFPNGSDWSGDGAFEYRRPAVVIGRMATGKAGHASALSTDRLVSV